MSVSDATTVIELTRDQPEPEKTKWVFRSDQEWQRIRTRYETAQPPIALRALADLEGISISTVMKRSAREGWKQPREIIQRTRAALVHATNEAIEAGVKDAAAQAAASILDQLQPIIEREKAEHIQTQILRSKGHLSRLDHFLKRKSPLEPKDEAYLSKAVSSHVTDLRRTLGMNDGAGFSGNLNVQILAGQAAVQLSQS